jgi:pyrroloquinoline quinone biosynthesis protein E
MNAPVLAPPLAVLLELTHRCPLQCPYCSNPLELLAAREELSTDEWCRVLDEAAALGVLQVHFSGGEPALRRDLPELVEHARRAGLYSNLITSGVVTDRSQLAALADAGLDHAQLSIQDVDAQSAEKICHYRNALARKREFAANVRALGLPLTLNAVVHRQNLERLPAMIELAVALDALRLEIAHVQYYGWALRNIAALMPTRAQVDAATRTVIAARERLQGRLVIDYVVPDYYASRPKACMGGWGQRFLNVTPNGCVLPCHAAQTITDLHFDSVREKSLTQIWNRSEAFERYRGTDWMREPCRSCAQREVDWGGCRCQALALSGRADAADPACALSPAHAAMRAHAEAVAAAPAPAFIYRRPAQKNAPAPVSA